MTPLERRTAILKLIAEIDQDIAEARELASDESLPLAERTEAVTWLAFYESAAQHTETLLRKG